MSKLTSKQRNSLPASDFADKKNRRFPVNDASHARNALARVSQFGSPSEKSRVMSMVHDRFPGIETKK